MPTNEITSRDGYLVYVDNLGAGMTETGLLGIIKPLGRINYIRLGRHHETGCALGYAFVEMRYRHEAVGLVKKLRGTRVENRVLLANPIF